MTDVKDWRGTLVEVGALIVYPTAQSSNVTMNEAIVAEIDFNPETKYLWGDRDPVTGQRARSSYIEQVPFLRVRKTMEHGYRHNSKSDQTKLQKLTRVDRVTVVEGVDPEKCNDFGCTAERGHDDPNNFGYWPAHSFERTE